jgi:hypothetical protein
LRTSAMTRTGPSACVAGLDFAQNIASERGA